MRSIYLDSSVLIAYFSADRTEETKRGLVRSSVGVFGQLRDARLCTSMWAVTEMVNVLVSAKRMEPGLVAQIENQLINERRLNGLRVDVLDVSPRGDYDFAEFFFHVREGILTYHSGVGDTIHSVIMKNNAVEMILTFDEKDDFKQIAGMTVLHPRDVKLPAESTP